MLSFLGPTVEALVLLVLIFFFHTVNLTKFFTMHIHSIAPNRFPPHRALSLKQIDLVEMMGRGVVFCLVCHRTGGFPGPEDR